MAARAIIKIDESKCNGCGLCVPSCAEGAIKIIDGKARIVSETYCDGLGACLGECPQGALSIEEREAPEFDLQAAQTHMDAEVKVGKSELAQWPIQLMLVPSQASYFKNSHLLVTADCVPFAVSDFHNRYLAGKSLVVGCPKLDDAGYYVEKLAEIIAENSLKAITVLHMEVPCCFGLSRLVDEAVRRSGIKVMVDDVTIPINGKPSCSLL
jgi:Pyruvate/2-oxoacid:ferredoxin oxidoreductase delta subunit